MRFQQIILFSLLLGLLACQKQQTPPFDLSLLESSGKIVWPSEAPDHWLLAHIDVETTGLVPGYHEMIDIGIVMTDLHGNILDSLFLRIQPQHPERISPGAAAVNAYDYETWESLDAFSHRYAVDQIIAFHKKVAGEKQVLMTAFNSQFDAAFLDHLFRSVNRSWRELYFYFVLDIPSMAWGLGYQDLITKELMDKYKIVDEPHIAKQHTGITGAMKNVRVYQAILKERKRHTGLN